MKPNHSDTIVAQATASGRGGIGIVRLSGKTAKSIGEKITQKNFSERVAEFTCFYDEKNNVIDQGIILYFQHPHSFTGEDVVELQAHGSSVVLDQLIKTALHFGARMANPGEFSLRAFLNKKIDLAQAESICDLINAQSERAAQSAVRSLQGEFSQKIKILQTAITQLRMHVESAIDFPEEEIDFLSDSRITELLQKTIDDILTVKNQAKQGALLQSGLQIVIAGKPNVGKSSLLNYFSGRDSAIVTSIPGTTRDSLRESINLDGLTLHIIDTAGLRETDDVIEQEGMKRAHAHIAQADLILLVINAAETASISPLEIKKIIAQENKPILLIKNKIDLTNEKPEIILHNDYINDYIEVKISVEKKYGLELLISALKKFAGFQTNDTDSFIARRRHVDAISRATYFLLQGQSELKNHHAGELLAEDLRQAQLALSEITGEFSSDDLLGEIFSTFCVGK